jgi:hypothetical protein
MLWLQALLAGLLIKPGWSRRKWQWLDSHATLKSHIGLPDNPKLGGFHEQLWGEWRGNIFQKPMVTDPPRANQKNYYK